MAPAPISWPPSQYWDGDDGPWSTFALRVGDPPQVVRVFPSTTGQATWVVTPEGCLADDTGMIADQTCPASRGGLFNASQSTSWSQLGNYSLGLEDNLGYQDSGTYGLDTISLGFSNAGGGPTLKSQVVTGIATDDFYLGTFGLGVQGTNLTTYDATKPSYLTTLKSQGLIPSLSWAYTAGAKYRNRGFFGSLTLGGYDSSRFTPNYASHSFAPDISRDLVVTLESIITNVTTGISSGSLLLTPIATFIDSTLPYIYLPLEACQAFEGAFGLEWNETVGLYSVNDTLHQTLLKANPTLTFGIRDPEGGPTTDIVFPYASFDLHASPPLVQDTMRYFPLRRAANDSQYTLGRTFLQEAYVITDYEHSNFTISQCRFNDNYPKSIVPIPSATATPSHIRRETIIGASVGAALFLISVIVVFRFVIRKRRRKTGKASHDDSRSPVPSDNPSVFSIGSVREIDNNSMCGPVRELPDTSRAEILDEQLPSGSGNEISEMCQPFPPTTNKLNSRMTASQHSMVQTHTVNTGRIFISTGPPRRSYSSLIFNPPLRISFTSFDSTPYIENVVSASAHCKTLDGGLASTPTSKSVADIYSLYMRESPNLDRSLPPTPISESPQTSPVVIEFEPGKRSRPLPQMSQVPARGSMFAVVSPEIPTSRYASASKRHKRRSAGVFPTGLEVTVPPGQLDPTTRTGLVSSQGHGITSKNWF